MRLGSKYASALCILWHLYVTYEILLKSEFFVLCFWVQWTYFTTAQKMKFFIKNFFSMCDQSAGNRRKYFVQCTLSKLKCICKGSSSDFAFNINPLSANPTKWSTNCLSVFDCFFGLRLMVNSFSACCPLKSHT